MRVTVRSGRSNRTKPRITRPRSTRPAAVSAMVGVSRYPEPATARYPLATRPSSENWKKRSTEGRPLGHALACERSITLFYQRAGLPTAFDFETVLPKQFSGRPVEAHEVDPRLRSRNHEAGSRSLCRHSGLVDTAAEAIHHFQPVRGRGRQIRQV